MWRVEGFGVNSLGNLPGNLAMLANVRDESSAKEYRRTCSRAQRNFFRVVQYPSVLPSVTSYIHIVVFKVGIDEQGPH